MEIIHKRRSFDNFCNAYLKKIFFKRNKKNITKKDQCGQNHDCLEVASGDS